MKMVTQQKQGEVCTQLKQQRVERAAAISQSQVCIYMRACMHVCMYMYVCMYVCMYMYIYVL